MTAAKTLEDLGWPTLVDHWAKRCATRRGEAHVRTSPLFESIDDARARAAEITEARKLSSLAAPLPLGSISDIADAIARVRKSAALDAPELVAVATTGRSLSRLRAHLREHVAVASRLATRGEAISDLGHVYHPILEAFDADGRLVDHASDALGPLRRALASIKAQLEKSMSGLLTDERFAPYLQDAYYTQREDRYVLPIRTDGKGFVHGIVHGTSQSGQTLFIEPEEIVDLNNRAKLAEAEVLDEERRILAKFSGWVAEEADAFEAALATAETLDVIAAAAIMGDDTISAEPILDDAPRIALLHARHPLMLLAERRCVANDVTVAAGATLLISGPNAGGKTVALKTVGLAALMARAGLHLTAESGSAMGWFPDVRSDIGDAQSLENDLSTFSGHMVNLRELLATAGSGSLVLIDEIAVGTDPEQGAALAQAVLEALADRGVTAIVTTHYERLKELGAVDQLPPGQATDHPSKFANASVGFDLARLEPTFKLHLGVPGSSGALAVATRMGISNAIVERARELMGPQIAKVEDLLASVADQRRRIEEERAALLAELEAAEAERAAARAFRERSQARFEKQTRAAHGETLAALKAARREIDEVRREVKARAAMATIDDVKDVTRRLAEPGSTVARLEPRRPALPGMPARPEQLTPGAPVIVPNLGRVEVVELLADDKVEVRVGSMRATVPIKDVLLDSHRNARRAGLETRAKAEARAEAGATGAPVQLVDGVPAGGRATARTLETTVDVRGHRVDEAVIQIDRFVDESLLAGRETIFVIHGHGTGALKKAVRAHLQTHKGIDKLRAGEPNEGGDGVTVAFLKG
ncbi:MAG: Smr/MutS family protein [Deltaproteobacteria bacterium]|nr:Smr/MutS family protein [Deltaproteobacteria bacterium]